MIRLTFLGTSGSAPSKGRGLPSFAVWYDGGVYLFDCGEGTQRQMLKFGVNASSLRAIFITHVHGDHTIGIAGLLRTLALNRRTAPLEIFVPTGSEKAIAALASFDGAHMGYEIVIRGVHRGIVFDGGAFAVEAFGLEHSVPAYGYAFVEKDRVHFIKEKAARLGIKGTMFRELSAKGSIRIGRGTVRLGDVTTTEKGVRIVYASDTRPAQTTMKIAKGADLLIHEATYANELARLAEERMHSTASEAAAVARKAGVKMLMLTHISTRYKTGRVLQAEARKVFKNTEVAKDGLTITL